MNGRGSKPKDKFFKVSLDTQQTAQLQPFTNFILPLALARLKKTILEQKEEKISLKRKNSVVRVLHSYTKQR